MTKVQAGYCAKQRVLIFYVLRVMIKEKDRSGIFVICFCVVYFLQMKNKFKIEGNDLKIIRVLSELNEVNKKIVKISEEFYLIIFKF